MSVFQFVQGDASHNLIAHSAHTLTSARDALAHISGRHAAFNATVYADAIEAWGAERLADGPWVDAAPLDTTRVFVVREGRESGRVYVTAYDVEGSEVMPEPDPDSLEEPAPYRVWRRTVIARTTLDALDSLREPDTADRLVFAYGANMQPETMHARCPGAADPEPAVLPGFRAMIADGRCDLIVDADGRAEGVAWRVPGRDMPGLDIAEGVTSGRYARQIGTLEDGRAVTFYAMTAPQVAGAMPSARYMTGVARGMSNLERLQRARAAEASGTAQE